jgi:thioredoxin 1
MNKIGMIKKLSEGNFKKEIEESNLPVIVDFYADWCAPCKMMAPVFEELAEDYKDKIKFMQLDVEEERALTEDLDVVTIPTLIIFNKGVEVERIMGYAPKERLKQHIDYSLNTTKRE